MPAKKRGRLLRRTTPKKLIPPFSPRVHDEIVRLSEQGECPYCRFPLQEHTVGMSENPALIGEQTVRPVLTFWKCTSEHCSLMFWRKPKSREVIKRY